jgi:hypothetical protein
MENQMNNEPEVTPPTREPDVIALLRNRPEGFNALYNADESYLCQGDDVLAAYDAIAAERDAAVQSIEKARDYGHRMDALAEERAIEAQKLRNRLAACERVVEAARLWAQPEHGYDHKTQIAAVEVLHSAVRAAVAAETQGEK